MVYFRALIFAPHALLMALGSLILPVRWKIILDLFIQYFGNQYPTFGMKKYDNVLLSVFYFDNWLKKGTNNPLKKLWLTFHIVQNDVRETKDGCDPCPGPFGKARNRTWVWNMFGKLRLAFCWLFLGSKELYPFKHRSPSITSRGGSSPQTSRIGGHPKRGGGHLAVIIYLRVTIFYSFFIDISQAVGEKWRKEEREKVIYTCQSEISKTKILLASKT